LFPGVGTIWCRRATTPAHLGLSRFSSLQAYYSVAGRDLEREIVPLLESEGVGLLVWGPLAGGLLSGKQPRGAEAPEGSRRRVAAFPPVDYGRAYDALDVMRCIAETHGVSVAQIALAWLLHQKVVSSVVVGAKHMDQLEDNLRRFMSLSPTRSKQPLRRSVRFLPNIRPG
jgi:aryl-alcohol dehydrogenase-like predicted oxidoreductase